MQKAFKVAPVYGISEYLTSKNMYFFIFSQCAHESCNAFAANVSFFVASKWTYVLMTACELIDQGTMP